MVVSNLKLVLIGVKVALYVFPLPEKLLNVPPKTVISFKLKFVVAELDVNVRFI